jgi:hypothetical protein
VETGLEEIDGKIKRQYMEIHLWPTPLALPETDIQAQFFTGEIKRIGPASKYRPPKIELPLGDHTFRFSRQYSWEKAIVGESEGTVRVPRPTLSGKLRVRRRATSPASVANDIAGDLEDFTALLSLLSRRHVRWSRIALHSVTESEAGRRFETFQKIRGSPSSHREREEEPLLAPRRLPDDALGVLSKAFMALNKKDMCKSAILYLLGARDSSFIDERIANSYTAFETALGASTSDSISEYTMGAAAFKGLAGRLRDTVEAFATERKIPPEMSQAVYAKIPELRRRPIVDRAIEQLSRLEIQSTDLWPASVDVRLGMSAVYKRRNRFIHSGQFEFGQASVDADRLIILTERLLMSLLPIDPKWLNPWANPELRYLRQTAEPLQE